MVTEDQIGRAFERAGMSLSLQQIAQFKKYYTELLSWNPKAGLISKRDESRIVERHFLESAALVKIFPPEENAGVLDLGTGGGFPGLPMKLVRPDLQMSLLDSRRWKVLFLKSLLQRLDLQEVNVIYKRAEDLMKDPFFEARFDLVVSRAVMVLARLMTFCQYFVKPGGSMITLKGSNLQREIAELPSDISGKIETAELSCNGYTISGKLQLVRIKIH